MENDFVEMIQKSDDIDFIKKFKSMNSHATTSMDNAFMARFDEYKDFNKPETKNFFTELEDALIDDRDYSEIINKNAKHAAFCVLYMNNMFRNKLVNEKLSDLTGQYI